MYFHAKYFLYIKASNRMEVLCGNHRALLLSWAFPLSPRQRTMKSLNGKRQTVATFLKLSKYLICVIRNFTPASIVSILEGKSA